MVCSPEGSLPTPNGPVEVREDAIGVGLPNPGVEVPVPRHLRDMPRHRSVERPTEQLRRVADDSASGRRAWTKPRLRLVVCAGIAVVYQNDAEVLHADQLETAIRLRLVK